MEKMIVLRDGDTWFFVLPDFVNLQVSPAVFVDHGDTDIDAIYAQLTDPEKFLP